MRNTMIASVFVPLAVLATGVMAALPAYTGQYGVGIIDVEVPVSRVEKTSYTIAATGQPAFELDTVLFALYYPTNKDATSASNTSAHYWVPKPQDLVARGFAAYAGASGANLPIDTIISGLQAIAGSITIPAAVDGPLASGNASFPVMIFSHGDAGDRTFYSHYLGELASRGVVVAAVEHRDGSCPGTQVITKSAGLLRNVTYFAAANLSPNISATDFKTAQRNLRQSEIRETYNALSSIGKGSGAAVYANNSRNEGTTLSSGWSNRLNFDQLIIAGHSFGATLVTQILEPNVTSSIPVKAAIALDPGKDSGPLYTNVSVPILIMDSESWSSTPSDFYGTPHFDVVKSIASSSLNTTNAGWFMTLRGAGHGTITDAGLISPIITGFFDTGFNTTINTTVGLDQYIKVSGQFLSFLANGTKGENLAAPVTFPQYNTSNGVNGVPDSVGQYWQIHVAPASNSSSTTNDTGSTGTNPSVTSSNPTATTTQRSGASAMSAGLTSLVLSVVIGFVVSFT